MRSILITGAEGGIGGALVASALAKGDRVFAAVRTLNAVGGLEPGPKLHVLPMDVGVTASVNSAFQAIDDVLAGAALDAVIHCAAISPLGVVELSPLADYRKSLNVNTLGSLRVMRNSIPRLRGHDGTLVLVTSLWGKLSGPMISAYAASKHAVEALADAARRETHGMRIRIVVVEPGVIKTPMLDQQLAASHSMAQTAGSVAPASAAPVSAKLAIASASYDGLYRSYAGLVASGSKQALAPARAAAAILRIVALTSPKARYRVGGDSKALGVLGKVLSDRAMDAVFRLLMR